MTTEKKEFVGVIGAGSFGLTIANLLSHNVKVLLFARRPEVVQQINEHHFFENVVISRQVTATNDPKYLADHCTLLFPVISSDAFRAVMQLFGPYLKPSHLIIHATKGFDIAIHDEDITAGKLRKEHIMTMSQVIKEETSVRRIGCLAGPNLAIEIMQGQPTATVIGSPFEEVIAIGKKVLSSDVFHVFGTSDLLGAEFAGGLKNIFALGSGLITGKGLGKNIQAMLLTRGLMEMIYIGKAFGAGARTFIGTAGIGDLIATGTSENSRNFSFGYKLGQGENRKNLIANTPELAEGIRTLYIFHHLALKLKLRLPITKMLYQVIYEDFEFSEALNYLITYPYDVDVDILF
jgi:glycerol-3-phosphate dehydrogenase (NAD(P)+)